MGVFLSYSILRSPLQADAKRSNVAIFDKKGTLLEEFNCSLVGVLRRSPGEEYHAVNEEEFHEFLHREFGFRPALVRVKEFSTDEGLAVHLLPSHYQDYVDNPDSMDEERWGREDLDHYPLLIQSWIDRGDFVLDWGNDYFMDATGEVNSS